MSNAGNPFGVIGDRRIPLTTKCTLTDQFPSHVLQRSRCVREKRKRCFHTSGRRVCLSPNQSLHQERSVFNDCEDVIEIQVNKQGKSLPKSALQHTISSSLSQTRLPSENPSRRTQTFLSGQSYNRCERRFQELTKQRRQYANKPINFIIEGKCLAIFSVQNLQHLKATTPHVKFTRKNSLR